jgi:hypothetical protein
MNASTTKTPCYSRACLFSIIYLKGLDQGAVFSLLFIIYIRTLAVPGFWDRGDRGLQAFQISEDAQ